MANPLGSTPGIIVGIGVGTAASAALEPAVELPRQKAWSNNPNRELDPATLARLVAQGGIELEAAHEGGKREGYDTDKVDALVYLSQTVPPIAEALDLWRKGLITDALWEHVLIKSGLDARYLVALSELKDSERLDPSVIALAIVRGIMDDPGFLPVGPPSGAGQVEPFPRSRLDTLKEAAASGFDRDRLFVQTAISGRPMGPESAASATFRQIIERVDFDRAISEGDVRNEWADSIFETARQIASVADYVQAHLRGWITEAEMYAGTARHGMSRDDTHLLYLRAGRPAAPGAMATAAVRGINGPDGRPMDREQFLKGIKESDIRPEWGPMLWDARFLYPPLFQLTRLVQAHAITADTAVAWATKDRYAPEVVAALSTYWHTATSGGAKDLTKTDLLTEYEGLYITEAELLAALEALGYTPEAAAMEAHLVDARRVKSARDKVVKAVHDQYVGHGIQRAEASAYLEDEQLPAEAIGKLLTEWDHELAVARKTLTPTQIVRAFRRSVIDRATALDELQAAGYSATDAATLLDSNLTLPPQAPLP